jgi:hypothetical protein
MNSLALQLELCLPRLLVVSRTRGCVWRLAGFRPESGPQGQFGTSYAFSGVPNHSKRAAAGAAALSVHLLL